MSKSIRNSLKAGVAALALLGAASVSASSVETPVNGSLIDTTIFNSGGTILSVLFDLSGTSTPDGPLVFDKLVLPTPSFAPPGASFALIGSSGDSVFGFSFVGFTGGSFTFHWDPDTASNPLFGALPADLAGTSIYADVEGGPDLRGVLVLDANGGVGTELTPVPEPETYALMLAGLAVVAGVARRRQAR